MLRVETEGNLDLGRALSLSRNSDLIQTKDPPLPLGRQKSQSFHYPRKKRGSIIGIKTANRAACGVCGGGYSNAHADEYGSVPSHQSISPGLRL